jgi:hypothetical protein
LLRDICCAAPQEAKSKAQLDVLAAKERKKELAAQEKAEAAARKEAEREAREKEKLRRARRGPKPQMAAVGEAASADGDHDDGAAMCTHTPGPHLLSVVHLLSMLHCICSTFKCVTDIWAGHAAPAA